MTNILKLLWICVAGGREGSLSSSPVVQRHLDKFDGAAIFENCRRRGWIAVPKDYAMEAFPKEAESGWWPASDA